MVNNTRKNPKVSVIIPSLDGYRNGNVPRLLEELKKQTFKDFEVIVSKGIRPNGRARNEGVKQSKGEIFVFIDDDVIIGTDRLIENLIKPFEEDPTIGITGASQLVREDSNKFQKQVARQFPRTYFPIVHQITETDMVSHMCLCVPRKVFNEVGGESDYLVSGTDPDFKARVRKAGYKVVAAPETSAYHPLPKDLKELLKKSYSGGYNSACVQKTYPESVYDTSPSIDKEILVKKNPFLYRILRFVFRLIKLLITFKLIYFLSQCYYLAGYIKGYTKSEAQRGSCE